MEQKEKTKVTKVKSLPMIRIKSYILISKLGYGSFGEIFKA